MMSAPVDPRTALDSANESDLVQKKLSIDAMRKRVSGGPSEEAKLREACEGFESIFLQKMWEQMRKNVKKEGYLHSKDEEAYQSMFDVELAKKMASAGGIGLADMLYEQLGQKLHNASKTTGSGLMRAPLPIDPAAPPQPEVAKAPAAAPLDLYAEVEELEVPVEPKGNPLTVALDELAASRDPSLDPANATYPMFDLQTGDPMNVLAEKMKEDSAPKREFDVVPLPERVSAPGKVRPSNAVGNGRNAARNAKRAAKGARNLEAVPATMQPGAQPGVRPDVMAAQPNAAASTQAARNVQAAPAVSAAAESVRTAPGNTMAGQEASRTTPSMQGEQAAPEAGQTVSNVQAPPDSIQAAPGAIPASTLGGPALGGAWPVKGDVVSSYGRQSNDGWNTGVSLAAAPDSPVTAPADGTVAFAGEKDGRGHLVIAHANGLTSHYGNVTTGLVPGDAVSAGMEIAKISAGTGFTDAGTAETASRMHFEVRRGELAINPESLLA
ncbi:putative Peptidase M23 family protein [uncultured delta proteobacterium]|uniref:Putative Peptidase M23 family protein n=1 Tax=uncultured delta proteobacterium TaxID=34034 RepID=A0A212JLW3_9DELT|nr:putative Peptidase M23 family protein [uncultured delta proteobacterium]